MFGVISPPRDLLPLIIIIIILIIIIIIIMIIIIIIIIQFAKKERQTGREVRKKRRELRDGVYPTNPPAQNDAHQSTQE